MTIDMVGKKFGRFSVLGRAPKRPNMRAVYWWCRCDCGVAKSVSGDSLRRGLSLSCGCYRSEKAKARMIHGKSRTSLYVCWVSMRQRCQNPHHEKFKNWGARGITVCDAWGDFETFSRDMGNPPSPLHSLDRIDNTKGYSPDNCRWATPKEQSTNTRKTILLTKDGQTFCVSDWAVRFGCSSTLLYTRIKKGWSSEKVLNAPIRRYRR